MRSFGLYVLLYVFVTFLLLPQDDNAELYKQDLPSNHETRWQQNKNDNFLEIVSKLFWLF